jgi:signal transduction histidine kinase/PAS domain-containing protein
MTPFRRAGIQLVAVLAVFAMLVIWVSWLWVRVENEQSANLIQQRLQVAAGTLKYLLPADFHDRARTATSISFDEELENRHKFNALKEALQLTWVYTLIATDNGFVFTAPSVSEEEARKRTSWYFYPYQDIPLQLVQALASRTNATVDYSDEWGRFRTYCQTETSPGGIPYLACADIELGQIENVTTQHLLIVSASFGLFLIFSGCIALIVRNMYASHIRSIQIAHDAAKIQETNLRTILHSLPVGVAVVDTEQRTVLYGNPKILEMLEMEEDAVVGKPCKQSVCTQCHIPSCPILDGLPQDPTGTPYITTSSGKKIPVIKAAVPASLFGRHVLVETLVDISAQKRLEAELLDAKESAEAGVRAKAQFLAMMTHELRTPLNGILGALQLLPHMTTPEAQRPMTEHAQAAARNLLILLNDILDLAALQGMEHRLAPSPHAVAAILDPIEQTFAPQARQKGLLWERSQSPHPTHILCDASLTRKAVFHVVANAIKFTPRGTVRLESWSQNTFWYVAISDTGPGIGSSELSKVFEPFTQADMSLRRQHGGSGIGLAIVAAIMRLVGGSICMESEPGAGTTCILVFPGAIPQDGAQF